VSLSNIRYLDFLIINRGIDTGLDSKTFKNSNFPYLVEHMYLHFLEIIFGFPYRDLVVHTATVNFTYGYIASFVVLEPVCPT